MFRSIFTGFILILLGATLVFADAGTVLVFPFENQSNDRNLDWIGEGIADLIIERLQAEPGLYVFQRDERLTGFEKLGIPESASISRATAMKLGWDTGSDRVITGRFTGTAEKFDIFARITTLSSSGSSQEIKVSGKLDDVIPLTNALSWQLLKIVVPGTKTPESDYISRPPIPRSAFENYIRGILSSDPKRRDEYFESAIRLRPSYAAAIFQLGRSKYFEGDFKLSNLLLEKMSVGDPYYLPAMFIVGMNDYRLADFVRSASVFGMLPRSYDVLVNLGAALLEKGEPLNAIAAWREAANRDPYGIEATFNIGYASFVRGDMDGAVKGLEQTLRLQGRDNEAMFLLARTYERLGRIDESQKMMTQATRQSPRTERWLTQPLPKLTRLRTMPSLAALRGLDAMRTWSAERLARRAKGQDLPAWLDFIENQIDSEQYGDALRELKELRMVYPDSSEAHVLLGQLFEHQKSYDQAVAEYQASVALRPAAETFVMMARVYKTLNQPALALRAVEQALKLDPDHAAAKTLKAELTKSPPRRGKS